MVGNWIDCMKTAGVLLMMVNPVSKILLLSLLTYRINLLRTVTAGTLIAGLVLTLAVLYGCRGMAEMMLYKQVAVNICGISVLYVGGRLLWKPRLKFAYRHIVFCPLACPMIAGPNSFCLCMINGAEHGFSTGLFILWTVLFVDALMIYAATHFFSEIFIRFSERKLGIVAGIIMILCGSVLLLLGG